MGVSDIFPEGILDILPLHPEALTKWSENSDLQALLYKLYDSSGIIIDSSGIETSFTYRFFGKMLFERGHQEMLNWAERFAAPATAAQPAPAASVQNTDVPDFPQDEMFGLMAKYKVAWEAVVQHALEESLFFSISHMLEASEELDSSMHLAAHMYYKQALQILRNFLEDLVLPIHFCRNYSDFEAWRSSRYRIPALRGSGGILRKLTSAGTISQQVADKVSDLYDDLNGCIHGSEFRLIHKGFHTGDWVGHVFKHDDFRIWCNYVAQCVGVGIHLLRTSIVQWFEMRDGKPMCSICHNDKLFDTQDYEFAGRILVEYRCRKCGNRMTLSH